MQKPTELLVAEHDIIERMLNVLNEAADRLQRGDAVAAELFVKAADFIQNFADRCHHAKEEDILFKLMGERGIPTQGGPIAVMLIEHNQGRGYRKGLADAAERLKNGDASAEQAVIENARNYSALLSQHIQKENNILYPMANQILSEQDQQNLQREFERVENDVIGKGVHEKYHHLVEELEKQMGL